MPQALERTEMMGCRIGFGREYPTHEIQLKRKNTASAELVKTTSCCQVKAGDVIGEGAEERAI